MARLLGTPYLRSALAAAVCVAAICTGAVGASSAPAPRAEAPRISLSLPAEVTRAAPATATGRVRPPGPGHVLLQVWRGRAWRPLTTGRVRHGRFRISFVLQGSTPSASRLRATLVRGRRFVASSAARRVRLRLAAAAPDPQGAPAAPAAAPAPAVAPARVVEAAPVDAPPPGVYWGAWIGSQLTGTAAPWDMNAVSKFEQLTGKPLSMIEFSSPFANCSTSPCSYFNFPWNEFTAIRRYGAIPFFSWGSQAIPGTADQSNFQLADILAGRYDSYIRAWATRAAEWQHPFFLRFDWEMNGAWFPWGEHANGNQPGEYVAAWRHVHDIFTSVGAVNATWVWCPYINQSDTFASLYPGDSYVDWTCLDAYNWGTNPAAPHGWSAFNSLYGHSYAAIAEALAPTKPMVIGETAASEYGGSKASWITEMFEALPTRYPRIRGLLWFENPDSSMDWPIESSKAATSAFATGISDSRYLGNAFGGIATSPIPAP
jgi:mannan endo-1,4-beta-mannosidase